MTILRERKEFVKGTQKKFIKSKDFKQVEDDNKMKASEGVFWGCNLNSRKPLIEHE
jgi:hypothetical protein